MRGPSGSTGILQTGLSHFEPDGERKNSFREFPLLKVLHKAKKSQRAHQAKVGLSDKWSSMEWEGGKGALGRDKERIIPSWILIKWYGAVVGGFSGTWRGKTKRPSGSPRVQGKGWKNGGLEALKENDHVNL